MATYHDLIYGEADSLW